MAGAIAAAFPDDSTPVIVHGHKHPLMLVAFLACVKSGHPYVPVDSSTPASQLRAIMESSGARLLLAVDPVECPESRCGVVNASRLRNPARWTSKR